MVRSCHARNLRDSLFGFPNLSISKSLRKIDNIKNRLTTSHETNGKAFTQGRGPAFNATNNTLTLLIVTSFGCSLDQIRFRNIINFINP